MSDANFESDIHPSDKDISDVSSQASGRSNRSDKSVFSTKIIKKRDFSYKKKEREKKALEEQKEMEERRKAAAILQAHGISQDVARKAARRASKLRQETTMLKDNIEDMINAYREEIREQKFRLYEMEYNEVERLDAENQKEEELWYNHGKAKTYF